MHKEKQLLALTDISLTILHAVYDRRMQIIIFKLKQRELLKLSSAKSDLIRKQAENASCMMKEFRTQHWRLSEQVRTSQAEAPLCTLVINRSRALKFEWSMVVKFRYLPPSLREQLKHSTGPSTARTSPSWSDVTANRAAKSELNRLEPLSSFSRMSIWSLDLSKCT